MKTIVMSGLLAGVMLTMGACSDGGSNGSGGGASGTGGSGTSGSASGGMNSSGSSSGGSGTAGSGTAGSGTAGSGTAGSGTAGSGTAGSGTAGSSGGQNAVCSPGTTIKAVYAYPDPIQNCGFTGKGELAGQDGFYASIKLPKPIGPGDEFSFSVGIGDLGQGTMELWGGSGECGEAHEHLATVEIPAAGEPGGVRCMTAAPQLGTYPYLIWVMQTAGMHGDVTLCPDVACPGE